MTEAPAASVAEGAASCVHCRKPQELCVCAAISQHKGPVAVLILRHPQEKDRVLGTARLVELQISGSRVTTGLSWRNLDAALGRRAEPRDWGVLVQGPRTERPVRGAPPVTVYDRKQPAQDQQRALAGIKGVIALDGNWSQAKTLWWRNPWLLKCRRLVLNPQLPSAYGDLRREPRRDSLSTLEAVALVLSIVEEDEGLYDRLVAPLKLLVERARAASAAPT